jgi:plasmid maintenance system antidote protein VapI
MKLNHCHSAECAQIVEALTAKANAYMEMMDANAKELDKLMAERKPLTDEQVEKLRHNIDWTASWSYINFARAIEAAHGITKGGE